MCIAVYRIYHIVSAISLYRCIAEDMIAVSRCIALYRAVSRCIALYRAVSLYPDIRLCLHVSEAEGKYTTVYEARYIYL